MARLLPYLMVFAAIVVGLLALPSVYDTVQIAQDAPRFTKVEAVVLSHSLSKHKSGPPTIDVTFEFETADGRKVRGDNRYTRLSDDPEEVERAIRREGGLNRMEVWYDPENPSRAVISHDVDLWRPFGIVALILIAIVGGAQSIRTDKKRRALQARADEAAKRKEEAKARRSG